MRLFTALSLASLFLSSCAGPAPPRLKPPIEEASVKPGINESFLSDDLEVGDFISRFEVETRDVAAARDAIINALGLRKGMDVADVGSGTGLFLQGIAERIGQSGHLYALDIAPGFIDHLENRVNDEGLDPPVMVRLSKERTVDLETRTIDLAFVCDTYHHFEYPKSMLWSMFRALRPGGSLVIVDFERIPGETREWLLGHLRADKKTFRAEVEEAGFEFVEEVKIEVLQENYFLRFRRP